MMMTDAEVRSRLIEWAIPRLVHKKRTVRHAAVMLLAALGVLTAKQGRRMIEGDD